MRDLTRKEKARAMRNGQLKMEREGCDWSIEDDIVLREMFEDGEDILDIALALSRKEPAGTVSEAETQPQEAFSHRPPWMLV